jgi:hypothetical protein
VRGELETMRPGDLRAAASVLLALERLPLVTPGVVVTFGFKIQDGCELEWADVGFGDDEFRLTVGQHFYDPSVGGDTESKVVFEAFAGGDREGSIDRWLEAARGLAKRGVVSAEDYSELEEGDWRDDGELPDWGK